MALLHLFSLLRNGRKQACNIVCTQPRRISAISVARRVADEWGCGVGNVVGYNVRLGMILIDKPLPFPVKL